MKDRHSYEFHNCARDERNRRQRAFKQLDPHDKRVIQREMKRLRIANLTEMQAFDLLSAIGEFLAKAQTLEGER